MRFLCVVLLLANIAPRIASMGVVLWPNFGSRPQTQTLWPRKTPPAKECLEIFSCHGKEFGYYKNLHNCSTAFNCQSGGLYTLICPAGYEFNSAFDCVQDSGCVPCPESTVLPAFCTQPFTCQDKSDGCHKDPWDCSTYFVCRDGQIYSGSDFIPDCPLGSRYNPEEKKCVSVRKSCVTECTNERPTPTPAPTTVPPSTTTYPATTPATTRPTTTPPTTTQTTTTQTTTTRPTTTPPTTTQTTTTQTTTTRPTTTPSTTTQTTTTRPTTTPPTTTQTTTTRPTTTPPTTTQTTTTRPTTTQPTTTQTTITQPTTTPPTTTQPTTTQTTTTPPTTTLATITETTTTRPTTTPPTTTLATITETTTTRPTTTHEPCVTPPLTTCEETCEGKCDGQYPSLSDCRYYYKCTGGRMASFRCRVPELFNPEILSCEEPGEVSFCWNCIPAPESPTSTRHLHKSSRIL